VSVFKYFNAMTPGRSGEILFFYCAVVSVRILAAAAESIEKVISMNVDQHLKVAQWHIEQARLHATTQHSCGCPVSEHYQKIIDEIEAGKPIEEELVCSTGN